jgi:hypothetical protein
MSLWYESLSEAMPIERGSTGAVLDILSHLAMGVPRQWWAPCLQDGSPLNVDVLVSLMSDIRACSKVGKRLTYQHLVALAFLDNDGEQEYGIYPPRHSIDEYIKKAEDILNTRPDVKRVAEIVASAADREVRNNSR